VFQTTHKFDRSFAVSLVAESSQQRMRPDEFFVTSHAAKQMRVTFSFQILHDFIMKESLFSVHAKETPKPTKDQKQIENF